MNRELYRAVINIIYKCINISFSSVIHSERNTQRFKPSPKEKEKVPKDSLGTQCQITFPKQEPLVRN